MVHGTTHSFTDVTASRQLATILMDTDANLSCHCLQGRRERFSLCFYSYFLAGMNYLSMCSTLLKIVHATHPALTRRGKHHYTWLASKFLCGCAMCNSLLSLLHYFLYIMRSDTGMTILSKYCMNKLVYI